MKTTAQLFLIMCGAIVIGIHNSGRTTEIATVKPDTALDDISTVTADSAIMSKGQNDSRDGYWLQAGVTLLGILVSASLLIWQNHYQHRRSMSLQREAARASIRLDIYERLRLACNQVSRASSSAGMYAFTMPMSLGTAKVSQAFGREIISVSFTMSEFERLHREMSKKVNALMTHIENFIIVEPKLEIFVTAFNVASYDCLNSHSELHKQLLDLLVPEKLEGMTPPGGGQLVGVQLTEDVMENTRQLCNIYHDHTLELGSYTTDLLREAQALLLGELFANEVPRRQSTDPNVVIVTTDPTRIEELRCHFNKATAWGKMVRSAESSASSHGEENEHHSRLPGEGDLGL